MVIWRDWYSGVVVRGLRCLRLCSESKIPGAGIKDIPHRYPKRSERVFNLKLWKSRGMSPACSFIRAVLRGGYCHLVTKRRSPQYIPEPFLMAGIPSFALGFLVATILYAGCFTLPDLITAMTGTVRLRIYSNSLNDYHQIPLRASRGHMLVDDSYYHKEYPTVFYFHGFTETPLSLSVLTVVQALLRVRPPLNVVVVDWSYIAGHQFYPIPALMTAVLGGRVARQIDRWIKAGALSINGLRLVGHSLGAHFAGFTAKAITTGRVPFLVGLDPAYPGFFIQSAVQLHISQSDAEMVTIIHSDGGVYGIPYNSGWADFYPNGGKRPQPGCPANTTLLSDADFCSHWRAWQIFAESLGGGDFVAVHCESYDDFLNGRCINNYQTRLDFFHPPSIDNKKMCVISLKNVRVPYDWQPCREMNVIPTPRGSYYFRTKSEEPLAMGPLGALPSDDEMVR